MLLTGSAIGHPWKFEPFKPTLIICTSIHSSSRVDPNYPKFFIEPKTRYLKPILNYDPTCKEPFIAQISGKEPQNAEKDKIRGILF